jgi:hypothetical protein
MPKLKNSIITEILNNLSYGDFCREDFTTHFPDNSSTFAKLIFSSMPKYTFEIEEYLTGRSNFAIAVMYQDKTERKKVIRSIESRGDYLNTEYHTHDDISGSVDRITNWVRNIREDLIHSKNTVKATIDDITAEFQSSIDEKIDNPEQYFEDQEKDDLIAKLDELKRRVESLEAEMGINPNQVKAIESAIEKSKADVDIYPKGVWYKTSGNKLMKLFKEALKSKEGREIATDIIRKLIS